MARNDFTNQFQRAIAAAQKAGDEWLAKHQKPAYVVRDGFTKQVVGTMLDVCGYGYVTTKRSTSFGKWCIANGKMHGRWIDFGRYTTHSGNQAMGLNTAMANAALKSLEADGVVGLGYYEWVD